MIDWKEHLLEEKPKYLAIEKMIISLIKSNELPPKFRLPSERLLAKNLNVNRSTVTKAFNELEDKKIIVRKIGSGTFINDNPNILFDQVRLNWHTYLQNKKFKSNNNIRKELDDLLEENKSNFIDSYSSNLPEELIPQFNFPSLSWDYFIEEQKLTNLNGYIPLLNSIKKLHKRNSNFDVSTEDILITGGVKQALFLILQGLLVPGDSVIIESPSFFHSLSLFEATGVRVYSCITDEEGIKINNLEKLIKKHKPKLILLNPSFQNPTGQVMSLDRRKKVIKLGREYSIPLVEDDIFGWLSFKENNIVPTLKELDPENVIYVSSLSKIMGENTRVGWLIASTQVINHLKNVKRELDLSESIFPQVMANLALEDENFQGQLEQLRIKLTKRADALYENLISKFPSLKVSKPKGGYYIWISTINNENIISKIMKSKVLFVPGTLFWEKKRGIRINFSRIKNEQINLFIKNIERIIK